MWINAVPTWINLNHVTRVEVTKRRPGDEPELTLTITQPGTRDITIADRKVCDQILEWLESASRPKTPDVPKKHDKAA